MLLPQLHHASLYNLAYIAYFLCYVCYLCYLCYLWCCHDAAIVLSYVQTHSTPVLLGAKDRAELANRDYVSVTSVLEGVVFLERAPQTEAVPTK